MVGENLISVKVFNLCALGNVTILHGLYLNIQTNNHLPPCKDLTKTQSMIWITCHHWGGLTWLHDVTWGYTIGDEGWRFEVRCSSPSCLLMPGGKETNKMLVMQHWDCWIESAHRVTGTELKISKLPSSLIMYNWWKMLTDWLWLSFEAFSQRLENWIIKKENIFGETSLKVNREP